MRCAVIMSKSSQRSGTEYLRVPVDFHACGVAEAVVPAALSISVSLAFVNADGLRVAVFAAGRALLGVSSIPSSAFSRHSLLDLEGIFSVSFDPCWCSRILLQ